MSRTVAQELASVDLFEEVKPPLLEALARHASVRRIAAGQVLFVQGDPSEHLILVRSGRLRVLVSSDRGDELVLALLGPGETLGELSVIDELPRSATVEALDASTLVLLPAAEVRTVLTQSPPALIAVARQLATEVRRLTGNAADLVFLDLPRRLAKHLLSLPRSVGAGIRIADLGVSQSGLAAQLGTTRQSVNRALAQFVQRGWIEVDGTRVVIRDELSLRRFSGS